MSGRVEPAEAVDRYRRWLASVPLAERSKREYARNVEAFCDWLAEVDNEGWGGDPLGDPVARDYAARDFKRFLTVERRLRPASVNLALASLDSLYRCLGLGSPNVLREELPQAAPPALDVDEQRRLLRAAERASARDRAIVLSMLFATVRLAELIALDVGDVHTTARKGRLVIRSGKGDAFREVPLNALLRCCVRCWMSGSRSASSSRPRTRRRCSCRRAARDSRPGRPTRRSGSSRTTPALRPRRMCSGIRA